MSEYIVDWDKNLVIDTFSKNSLREEIVRCRDCKHYRFEDRSHIFNDDRHNDSYCLRFVDGKRMEVEPNGFCAWAKRREP